MDAIYKTEIILLGLITKHGVRQGVREWLRVFPSLAAMDGGEGSGNFEHEGRPGKVGGSSKSGGKGVLSKEEAQHLLSSNWNDTIKSAITALPKAKNGRHYITKGDMLVDIPKDFVGEAKSEIFRKSKSKEEKIAALWAIKNIQTLFSLSTKRTEHTDIHKRPGVRKVIRFDVAFPLQIG